MITFWQTGPNVSTRTIRKSGKSAPPTSLSSFYSRRSHGNLEIFREKIAKSPTRQHGNIQIISAFSPTLDVLLNRQDACLFPRTTVPIIFIPSRISARIAARSSVSSLASIASIARWCWSTRLAVPINP